MTCSPFSPRPCKISLFGQSRMKRIRLMQCFVRGKTFSVHLFPPGEEVQRKVETACCRMFVPCFFSFACFRSKVSVPGRSCRGLWPRSCVGVRLHSPMDTNNKQYYWMRFLWYSEGLPYGHLGNAVTSLLQPLFLDAGKTSIHFPVKNPH